MKWIDISKELPVDYDKDGIGTTYLVTVVCKSWEEPKTMVMEWEETLVRNKPVKRWKWNNRLKDEAWVVTHWMAIPSPYDQSQSSKIQISEGKSVKKIKLIRTTVVEYEPNPNFYPDGVTTEEIAEMDAKAEDRDLLFSGDNVISDTVSYELVR
jgi:hypothetical protein